MSLVSRVVLVAGSIATLPSLAAAQSSDDGARSLFAAFPHFSIVSTTSEWTSQGRTLEPPSQHEQERSTDVFEVKPVDVKPGALKEEAPVGEYRQPYWTTFRRFPSTRVYLQVPTDGVQYEQWFQFRNPKDSAPAETRIQEELEFGLGHRLQLDLYMNELHVRDGANSTFDWSGYSVEMRYAFGDWNQIWGNPTLYLEYTFNNVNHDGPDAIEPKLLLGGEIAQGWHWGANFIHERSLAARHNRTEETSFTGSVSHTVQDDFFSLGATTEVTYEASGEDPATGERDRTFSWLLGPSIQLLPSKRAALSIEPLWGLTGDSLKTKIYVIFSWHF